MLNAEILKKKKLTISFLNNLNTKLWLIKMPIVNKLKYKEIRDFCKEYNIQKRLDYIKPNQPI